MSRALGVDLGERRVGLALSDPQRLIAQPYKTLHHSGDLKAVSRELARIVAEQGVTQLVVGWPLRLNGQEGLQTRRVARFVEGLLLCVSAPVARWDERLTTVAAERALLEGDVRRADRKAVVDQVAASLILQGWLDAQRAALPAALSSPPLSSPPEAEPLAPPRKADS